MDSGAILTLCEGRLAVRARLGRHEGRHHRSNGGRVGPTSARIPPGRSFALRDCAFGLLCVYVCVICDVSVQAHLTSSGPGTRGGKHWQWRAVVLCARLHSRCVYHSRTIQRLHVRCASGCDVDVGAFGWQTCARIGHHSWAQCDSGDY